MTRTFLFNDDLLLRKDTPPRARLALSFLVLHLSLLLTASGQAPSFAWAEKAGGALDDFGRGIAVDNMGNSCVTGAFSGHATFGATNLVSRGGYDIFLAKYNASGAPVWVRQAGSSSMEMEEGRAVALDAAGNAYVTGAFAGLASFGTTNLSSTGGLDMFVAKYHSSGSLLWVRRGGGNNNFEYGLGVAVDAAENCYVTGQFTSIANFGATNMTSRGSNDVFLAKYNSAGTLLWVRQAGGTHDDYGRGTGLDAAGNCYLTGHFSGQATFGSTTVTSAGSSDIFVVKYDSAGSVVWVQRSGAAATELSHGIAVDGAGNSHVLGWFNASGTPFSWVVVLKYNSAGSELWSRQASVNSDVTARGGIAVDAAGNSYITGQYVGEADFGGILLTNRGQSDIFVASYGPGGNALWAQQAGGAGNEEGRGIAVDGQGNTSIAGWFDGTADFDGEALLSGGMSDIFLTRLNNNGVRLRVSRMGGNVVVTWPIAASNFILEWTSHLGSSGNWSEVPANLIVAGADQYTATIPISAAQMFFFRLEGP